MIVIVVWEPGRAFWKNALGVVTTILVVPIVLTGAVIASLGGKQEAKSSPVALAALIESALRDPGEDDAWDELECVTLADPKLEHFRSIAASVGDPPWDQSQRATLQSVRAELLKLKS